MNVLKFGGTSVGTVQSLLHVKEIVETRTEPLIVVVSALGGVTDLLIKAGRYAELNDERWHEVFAEICSRHYTVIEGLIPDSDKHTVRTGITDLLQRLEKYYTGISLVEEFSPTTHAKVVSFGERMSSFIISHIIKDATLCYSPDFIKTECWWGRNVAAADTTASLIQNQFTPNSFKVAIVPGFISSDKETGDITNLGRGGSDYTASLIAAALDADLLEIWTDVDGFMTADPRIINTASVIPHLSYVESMDLCNFGAKVIYPPTIYPVFHKNIPIKILNTFRPTAPGTLITEAHKVPVSQPFRGVSSIADVSVIEVLPTDSAGMQKLRTDVLNILAKKGIEIVLADTRSPAVVRVVLKGDVAPSACQALKMDLDAESGVSSSPMVRVINDLSTVTLVGENLKQDPQAALQMLNTLVEAGLPIVCSGTGSSGYAMTAVVEHELMRKALSLLHSRFLEE